MHFKTAAVAAFSSVAFLASSGQALGAPSPRPSDYVGKHLRVDAEQLLFYTDVAKSYEGSLLRGASFNVVRLSPTGTFAYGFAYGTLNRRGWVRTAGLAKNATFHVREILTATTDLRGTVDFPTPPGWAATNRAASHSSATFDVAGPAGCSLAVSVSMRGVATRDSLAAQVRRAVGNAPLGSGTRRAGLWGSGGFGPLLSGGEGPLVSGIYGIAPIRVQTRRFGQVRVLGRLKGCATSTPDAEAFLSRGGPVAIAVNRLLVDATPDVRVVLVSR